jgi:hypothetical protein
MARGRFPFSGRPGALHRLDHGLPALLAFAKISHGVIVAAAMQKKSPA